MGDGFHIAHMNPALMRALSGASQVANSRARSDVLARDGATDAACDFAWFAAQAAGWAG